MIIMKKLLLFLIIGTILFGCTAEKKVENNSVTATQYDSDGNVISEITEVFDFPKIELRIDEHVWLYENIVYSDEEVIKENITDVKSSLNENMLEVQTKQFTDENLVLTINISYNEKNQVKQKEYLHVNASDDYTIYQTYNEQSKVNKIKIIHSNGYKYSYDLIYENNLLTKCLGYLNDKLIEKVAYTYK